MLKLNFLRFGFAFWIMLCMISMVCAQPPVDVDPQNIDIDKLDPNNLPSIDQLKQMGATDAEIDEINKMREGQQNEGIETGTKEEDMLETTEDGQAEEEPGMEEQVDEDLKFVKYPPAAVYGQGFFRNNNLSFFPSAKDVKAPENYVLGAGDELSVAIWGYTDFSGVFRVSEEGYIQPKSIGRIYLKGLTFEQAKSLVRRNFGAVYDLSRSELEVTLTYSRVIAVNIVGEVFQPGSYAMPAVNAAFNVLARVGGPNQIGSVRHIAIKRKGETIKILDVYKYLIDPEANMDFYLQDNDFIYVPTVGRKVKILKEVKRPHSYELIEGENLLDLIKYAGGLMADAYKSLIQVKRYYDNEEILIDVALDSLLLQGKDFELIDGDEVMINKIPEGVTNFIQIEGSIGFPGRYEFKEGMRISDALALAEGTGYDAYLYRAYVVRLNPDLSFKYIPVNLHEVMENPASPDNLPLQEMDVIQVLSSSEFREVDTVFIFGAVRQPGSFVYGEGMTLQDLLYLSGGVKREAANNRIEVARIINYNDAVKQALPTRTTVLTTSIGYDLDLEDRAKEFELQPFDQVFVRTTPEFTRQHNVFIEGEVQYPGTYAILDKEEKVLDLIQRAGDLTEWAFVKGASFIRRQDSAGYFFFDLEEVFKDPKSSMNYILKDGDVITIPTISDYIVIEGAIGYPGRDILNAPFEKSNRAKKYIKKYAAGFHKDAVRRKTYVQEPSGFIKETFSLGLLNIYPRVSEGAHVVAVYKKEKEAEEEPEEQREPIDWNDAIENATVKITGLLTLWILLTRIR